MASGSKRCDAERRRNLTGALACIEDPVRSLEETHLSCEMMGSSAVEPPALDNLQHLPLLRAEVESGE